MPDILLQCRSMRKTKLLLDAVEAAGRHDVTFAALDLCEDSLSQALSALQGEFKTWWVQHDECQLKQSS